MKKIISILVLSVTLFHLFSFAVSAQGAEGWFVKRNGNLQPRMDESAALLSKYNGYYIDKTHGDDCDEKILYLTFDAGYINENVIAILDTLKSENVPAAFFILAHPILKNTDIVERMYSEGHLVCNHTKNHKDLTTIEESEIKKNLTDLEKIYEEKTGHSLAKYFRPPEGKYNETTLRCANELGYKTVFWSFAYADWDQNHEMNPKKAINKVMSNTHNGAVILLHPTSLTNAKILPELIKMWREDGYTFGTLDQLAASN